MIKYIPTCASIQRIDLEEEISLEEFIIALVPNLSHQHAFAGLRLRGKIALYVTTSNITVLLHYFLDTLLIESTVNKI